MRLGVYRHTITVLLVIALLQSLLPPPGGIWNDPLSGIPSVVASGGTGHVELNITKIPSKWTARVGETVTVTIRVRNQGNATARGVLVEEPRLVGPLRLVGGRVGMVGWGDIEPGQTITARYNFTATEPGRHRIDETRVRYTDEDGMRYMVLGGAFEMTFEAASAPAEAQYGLYAVAIVTVVAVTLLIIKLRGGRNTSSQGVKA